MTGLSFGVMSSRAAAGKLTGYAVYTPQTAAATEEKNIMGQKVFARISLWKIVAHWRT